MTIHFAGPRQSRSIVSLADAVDVCKQGPATMSHPADSHDTVELAPTVGAAHFPCRGWTTVGPDRHQSFRISEPCPSMIEVDWRSHFVCDVGRASTAITRPCIRTMRTRSAAPSQGRRDRALTQQTRGTTVVAMAGVLDSEDVLEDELTALALAADPDEPVDPDAVPMSVRSIKTVGLLPEWYMPAPMSTGGRPARRWVLGSIVVLLVVINGAGLCVTYGVPEVAW